MDKQIFVHEKNIIVDNISLKYPIKKRCTIPVVYFFITKLLKKYKENPTIMEKISYLRFLIIFSNLLIYSIPRPHLYKNYF